MTLNFQKSTTFFYTIILIAIIGAGVVAFESNLSAKHTGQRVEHTHEVLRMAENVFSLTRDIVSSSRGFILTRDSNFLRPTFNSTLHDRINQLSNLVQDNPPQSLRVDSLRNLINKRIEYSTLEPAWKLIASSEGEIYLNEIRSLVQKIIEEENDLLQVRKAANSKSVIIFNRSFYVLLGSALVMITLAFVTTRRGWQMSKESKEKLVQMTDALKQAFNDTNKIMNSSLDVICAVDEQGCFVKVSAASEAIWGYEPTELIGKPILNYVYREDNEETQTTANNVMSGKSVNHFENRYIRKDGSLVPMEWSARWDGIEKVRYGVGRDITERKKAKDNLMSERALLRTIIDNIPDYIYVKDTQSRHLINNKANVELLGALSEKDTIGKSVNDFLDADIAKPYHEYDQLVFKSGKPIINLEETIISKSGERKYLLTTKVPIKDDNNLVTGLVGISRDITSQKKIELDLRQKKYFLEKSQQVGQIGYWISEIGSAGKLIWSEETCKIFGLEPAEFDGQLKTFFDFILPEDLDKVNSSMSDAVENNLIYRTDHRIKLRDGTIKWVNEQAEATYDENGKKVMIGIVQDITERKKAEYTIKESEAFSKGILNALSASIAVIDEIGNIIAVNEPWTNFALENGATNLKRTGIGSNYFEVCTQAAKAGDSMAAEALEAINSVMSGKRIFFEMEYPCHSPNEQRWFTMRFLKFDSAKPMVVMAHHDITDKKRASQNLQLSETRFREFFESAPQCLAVVDSHTFTFIAFNQNTVKLTKYSAEELLKKGPLEISPPFQVDGVSSQERAMEFTQRVMNGETIALEWLILDATGKEIICELKLVALSGTQRPQILVSFADISERKQIEEKLLASEIQYRRLFESAKDGILILNADTGVIDDVNPFLIEMLGYSHNEFLGMQLWEIGLFKDIVANQESFIKLQQRGYVRYDNLPLQTKGGLSIWVEFVSNAYDVGGKLVIQCNIRDITDRKKAESALIKSENYLRTILQTEPECVKLLDLKGALLSMNPAGLAMIEADNEEQVLGHQMIELVDSKYRTAFKRLTNQVFKGNSGTLEFQITGLKGGQRWLETHAVPMRDTAGEITSLLGVTVDITNRKITELEIKSLNESLEKKVEERTSQLQAVNKELEAFSYSVSHDLRAPLRFIGGYSHILAEDYANKLDEEGKRIISVIIRNASRMHQLIDDMLAFSKFGRTEMSLSIIKMKNLVESIVDELVSNEKDRIIHIEVANLHDAEGDVDLLRQVWINLIANALKFTSRRKETQISIVSYLSQAEVCYSIQDNGAGFDNQYAPKLYDIFHRLHKQSEFEGTGVGLAICKRIIERNGGRVWAEGVPDKGATFYFSLPIT